MKTTTLRASVNVRATNRLLAVLIQALDDVYYNERDRILRTLAFHFGYRLEKLL